MQVHGNPGDYAWGRGGLDAVITHLLSQLEGTGQAPLARDQIQAIPEVKISRDQVRYTRFRSSKLVARTSGPQ